jgi:hypothetical protein
MRWSSLPSGRSPCGYGHFDRSSQRPDAASSREPPHARRAKPRSARRSSYRTRRRSCRRAASVIQPNSFAMSINAARLSASLNFTLRTSRAPSPRPFPPREKKSSIAELAAGSRKPQPGQLAGNHGVGARLQNGGDDGATCCEVGIVNRVDQLEALGLVVGAVQLSIICEPPPQPLPACSLQRSWP